MPFYSSTLILINYDWMLKINWHCFVQKFGADLIIRLPLKLQAIKQNVPAFLAYPADGAEAIDWSSSGLSLVIRGIYVDTQNVFFHYERNYNWCYFETHFWFRFCRFLSWNIMLKTLSKWSEVVSLSHSRVSTKRWWASSWRCLTALKQLSSSPRSALLRFLLAVCSPKYHMYCMSAVSFMN